MFFRHRCIVTYTIQLYPRWCFQSVLFSPLVGEMIQFDQYFSGGLKPPTCLSNVLLVSNHDSILVSFWCGTHPPSTTGRLISQILGSLSGHDDILGGPHWRYGATIHGMATRVCFNHSTWLGFQKSTMIYFASVLSTVQWSIVHWEIYFCLTGKESRHVCCENLWIWKSSKQLS